MMFSLIYFNISFLICIILTPVVKKIAHYNGWLAYPSKSRWHKKPTALMGGIAIYIGFSIPFLWVSDFKGVLSLITHHSESFALSAMNTVLWIGTSFMFLLGLIDDFRRIKPYTKFLGQIVAASLVVFVGYRLRWSSSLTVDTILTIFWIVGITNAFNLLDNMDGLCTGAGLAASCALAFLYYDTSPETAFIAFMLAGALTAFLIFNFNPASIFMGDCGSLVIGFSLSVLSLHYSTISSNFILSHYVTPILIFIVPILDTSMVTAIRILSGRKAYIGGKDHTSHRLVLMGFTERGAVLVLYGIAFTSGLSAIFVSKSDSFTSPAVIIPIFVSVVLIGIYLAQIRVYPEKEFSMLREKLFSPILMDLTYKRQILLIILDFCLIAFAYYLSYRLRFSGYEFGRYFKTFLHSLPAVIICKFTAFYIIGVYRGIWRYLSINDVYIYVKASLLASILSVSVVTFVYRFEHFSKGIFIIDWILATGMLIGTRGSFRFFTDIMKRKTLSGDAVIIYGAGRGGEIFLREILSNKKLNINPIGFIDDNLLKVGKQIQGYQVLGTLKDLEIIYNKSSIMGLLISFNNINDDKLTYIKEFCIKRGIFLKQFKIDLNDI
ncbi:UDP-GlcNAc:undecaprenyl-phosphate/decaprenyl-phosphate GlcNAc-1-phosphate transferase [Candidatus Magnetomoraceae bacterium gMMP-15]